MRRSICSFVTLIAGFLLIQVHASWADDKLTTEQTTFFESKIRPVLVRECYGCHSTKVGEVKGGLWLDTQEGMVTGGDSGPAIVAGDLEASLLWNAINHEDYRMPPGKKLSNEVLSDFRKWIEMGAPDPRIRRPGDIKSSITDQDIIDGRSFWSFQRPKKPSIPVTEAGWPVSEIDSFILRKLNENSLQPNPEADAATVLRRLTFDIVGLPPTPDQIQWMKERWDDDPDAALEHIVDSLLAKPEFGERWARHWLDVARYAESTGKEQNLTYPHAWRYRDYVIDSFNEDKPYHRFVQEQVAGDLLPVNTDEKWAENLVATGFLAIGPKTLTEQNARQFELDLVDEQIDVTTRVMLGVSVACARCHDHKFDPIPQTDYYALSGIFRSTNTYYGTIDTFQNRRPSDLLILPIDDVGPNAKKISTSDLAALTSRLAEKRAEQREAQRRRRMARMGSGSDTGNQREMVASFFRLSSEVGVLEAQVNAYDDNGNPYSYCMGVQSKDRPVNARLLERGEFDKPAQEVSRGFPQVLCGEPAEIESRSSGRLELARWIGSQENPLTARVMVNRIWLHLMGNGIVGSPENFGATGQPPTHPELLDYLAVEFMENDWSVKQLIKQIVTSRSYRTSSDYDDASFEIDPENKYLWRMEPKRLDAEVLRDSILAVSGQLDTNRPRGSLVAESGTSVIRDGQLIDVGATGMYSMRDRGNAISRMSMRERRDQFQKLRKAVKPIDQPVNYRSIYLPIVRDHLPRALEVFDFAEPTMVVGQRESSNTPDQGLYFLNNEFVIQQSDAMARRLIKEADRVKDQLENAFLLAYGRRATADEMRTAANFYRSFKPSNSSRRRGNPGFQKLSAVCQSILASAEFRYLN